MTFLLSKNRNSRKVAGVFLVTAAVAIFLFQSISASRAAAGGESSTKTLANSTKSANNFSPPSGTYTWVGGTPGFPTDWQGAANWMPTRTLPDPGDVLVFNGGSPTVTNVPTQTIAQLDLTNGALVTLNAATIPVGAKTLIISGGVLNVAGGTSLTVAGSTALTISVASGSAGTVGGQVILQDAAHRLLAADANGITFQNGSIFTTSSGFTGNPFGAGTDGSVVFQIGSAAFFNAGGDPFGGPGHSIATFNLNSSQTLATATAFSADGRTYGNLTLDGSQSYFDSSATIQMTIFNALTIASGSTLTLSGSFGGDLNLLGDITINGTFNANGRTVKFQGGGPFGGTTQNISTAATFGDVIVSKITGSVKLGSTLTVNGALQFNGTSSAVDVIDLNSKTLNLNGTVGGTSSSSSNGFKGTMGSTLNIGGTGALGTIRFVSAGQTLGAMTIDRSSAGTVTLGSNLTIGDASSGSLTLTNGVVNVGANTLILAAFPAISRMNGYVIGNLQKTFGATGNFTFTVGTANGYSPVDANITTGVGSNLTVRAVQGKHPAISSANALQRYWTLSSAGAINANLTFNYLATDVVGIEASYKIFKYNGSFIQFTPDTLDTSNHFATLNGVTSFSDWTLAEGWQLQFSTSNFNDSETNSDHLATITVDRVGGTTGAVDVNYATTAGGTATAGSDYESTSGTLHWANGLGGGQTFTVLVHGDTTYEAQETVNLTLSAATPGTITGGTNPATLTIVNDDNPPATLTVNTTDDLDNGACLASHCSLREAINAANFSSDLSTIDFNIPGGDIGCTGGICTISLATALPNLAKDMNINGPGASLMTIARSDQAATDFHVFTIYSGSPATVLVTISGLTMTGGRDFFAGGIQNLGTLTINDSAITNNVSRGGAGGIGNDFNGILTIRNSIISNNSALDFGGGINNSGALTLINSTVSGNRTDLHGGGIRTGNSGASLTAINSTITNNRSDFNDDSVGAGGGVDTFQSTTVLRNTIVAGNFHGSGSATSDISGAVDNTSSFDLIGDGTGMTGISNGNNGNQIGSFGSPIDPKLGPLASNGGPTQTHALLFGSPAIEAGNNSFSDAAGLTNDQRGTGFIRKADSADANTIQTVDIGAFEAEASIEDITDKSTAEDTPLSFSFNVGDSGAITSVTASSSNTALVPNLPADISVTGSGSTRTLNITPAANQFGSSTITVTVTSGSESMQDTFVLTVTAVADTPSVTPATTNEDTQTTSGLVISRNAADGSEVTHFKITGITNGALFKNNGTTQINNGDFITFAEGTAGLKFTPAANLFSPTTTFSFSVQAATDGSGSGLSTATIATITVNPVADVPSVTPATTIVNTQTTSGLVINRNAADGTEVTHFKITNITNGTLFKNDGTTQITNNAFITFAEGNAGLRFTPAHNLVNPSSTFSFQVQGATSPGGAGLGSAVTATITVNCGPTVVTNTNDSGAGSLRNAINTACPGDTITFAAGLTSSGPATITLTSAELVIDKNLTINGPGANVLTVTRSTAGGTPNFRILNIESGTVNISGLTMSNGKLVGGSFPTNNGGAIFNSGALTLTSSTVSGNTGGSVSGGGAGGIYNNNGTLTLTNSIVSGNNGGIGGGITSNGTLTLTNSTVSGNTAGDGAGGIFNNSGTLTLTNSTVSGNSAFAGGGIFNNPLAQIRITNSTISGNTNSGGDGAGILNSGNATLTNTTVSSNNSTGSGGGILNNPLSTITLTNSTVSSNTANASSNAGGGGIYNVGTTNLKNTIVANNTINNGTGPDLKGTFNSQDYNLVGNTSGATITGTTTHNITNTNANLGALGNNGGPTQTMLPLPGSPAINAGDPANLPPDTFDLDGDSNTAEPLPVDQRGLTRVVGTNFDIGAVETNYTVTATAGTPQSTTINSAFATPLQATVKESGNNQSGLTVTFTAPASGASGTFPGNVTTANVTTNASGVATAPVFTANGNAGGYNVSASVAAGLASANFALTNMKAATTTGLSSSVNPSDFGQNVSFTATVTSGAGTPTGTVQFKDSGINIGSPQTLTAGVAQVTTSSLAAGLHTITADYSGDANFLTSSGTLSGGQVVKTQPTLSINDVSMAEGNSGTTSFVFTVTLSAVSNLTVTTSYANADGTATLASNDYQSASGTLTFNPGDTTKTISVNVNGDTTDEPNETFFVDLTGPANATLSRTRGVGTILNDDAPTIQFSSASYIVNESTPRVEIALNRSGDTTSSSSIDYKTIDDPAAVRCDDQVNNHGAAYARCDYATGIDTVNFAPGETTKVFTIPIIDDGHAEGPEMFQVTLSNPAGATLGLPSTATVTINDNDNANTPNPILAGDDTGIAFFVRVNYLDFLGREPEPGEPWSNILRGCSNQFNVDPASPAAGCDRLTVSGAIFGSPEFLIKGVYTIEFYDVAFNRLPAYAEFAPDLRSVTGATAAETNAKRAAFANAFVQRPEFVNIYGGMSNQTYVNTLMAQYGLTSITTPDPANPDGTTKVTLTTSDLINRLNGVGGTLTRAQVLRAIVQSDEVNSAEAVKSFVAAQYYGYLRRTPETPGFNDWVNYLNTHPGDYRTMVNGFMNSLEYRLRFGRP